MWVRGLSLGNTTTINFRAKKTASGRSVKRKPPSRPSKEIQYFEYQDCVQPANTWEFITSIFTVPPVRNGSIIDKCLRSIANLNNHGNQHK